MKKTECKSKACERWVWVRSARVEADLDSINKVQGHQWYFNMISETKSGARHCPPPNWRGCPSFDSRNNNKNKKTKQKKILIWELKIKTKITNGWILKKYSQPAVGRPVAVWASYVCFVAVLLGDLVDTLLAKNVAKFSNRNY